MLGNIHSDETLRLYKSMNAPPDILEILYRGVELHWKSGTPFHRLSASNNASATDNQQFVSETLRKWIDMGAAKVIPKSKAKIISPLSVSYRWDHSKQSMKRRLCFDGSRLKKWLIYRSVQLPDIDHLSSYIDPLDELSVVDLENFYFHISKFFPP